MTTVKIQSIQDKTKETYRTGDFFLSKDSGAIFQFVQVGPGFHCLINLETGNRQIDPIDLKATGQTYTYFDICKLIKEELIPIRKLSVEVTL